MNPNTCAWLATDATGTLEAVQSTERILFKQMVQKGQLQGDSVVFDTSITSIDELRAGKLEGALADSWAKAWIPQA